MFVDGTIEVKLPEALAGRAELEEAISEVVQAIIYRFQHNYAAMDLESKPGTLIIEGVAPYPFTEEQLKPHHS